MIFRFEKMQYTNDTNEKLNNDKIITIHLWRSILYFSLQLLNFPKLSELDAHICHYHASLTKIICNPNQPSEINL